MQLLPDALLPGRELPVALEALKALGAHEVPVPQIQHPANGLVQPASGQAVVVAVGIGAGQFCPPHLVWGPQEEFGVEKLPVRSGGLCEVRGRAWGLPPQLKYGGEDCFTTGRSLKQSSAYPRVLALG